MSGADNGHVCILAPRTGVTLAERARTARSFAGRLTGLLGRSRLEPGEGLILPGCRSLHTCGMQFPIDAVFVDKEWRVVALRQELKPWRVTPLFWHAHAAVELPQGAIQEAKLKVGDALILQGETG